jgi:hypothetical protein
MLLSLLLAGPAAAQQEPDTTGFGTALLRSRDAANALLGNLRHVLLKQLAAGGPVHAVNVCADTAQELSATIQQQQGVMIRRVSSRWRNPANRPDDYETTVLERFVSLQTEGELHERTEHAEIVRGDSLRVFRYLRPIMVQEMCLSCHGDRTTMKNFIATVLQDRYPADRAVGYSAGELRGAVSVSIPLTR